MSDESVRAALRSDAALVVVEAPAGCGKTYQGAEYARELANGAVYGKTLILTHTHAACSVFADRTKGAGTKVEIRTIDSLIANIADAYHSGLGIPADTAAWVRQQGDEGHALLASKVAALVRRYSMIAHALARRYPVVICVEHQDSSGDQHLIVMEMLRHGSKVRIFADPMQTIFPDKKVAGSQPRCDWHELRRNAQRCEELDVPHRWSSVSPDLGTWTLKARKSLLNEQPVDLKNDLPAGLHILFAENRAERHLGFDLSTVDRAAVDVFQRQQTSLLILTCHNKTTLSFRSFFNRRIPLWEGHVRTALEKLVNAMLVGRGDREALARATVTFMGNVGKGFSPSAFGDRFIQEAADGCVKKCVRKPAAIQSLARYLVDDASHRGVAKVLGRLAELGKTDATFSMIDIDHHHEFNDAIRLGEFESLEEGLAAITHRRTYSRPRPPARAISNIHKAKGLECDAVILMPCDATTFLDKREARCLLYVALSRAKSRLMLVVSRDNPSPLFSI